jgi:putative ABC transport system ATP-binding protein
MNTVVCKGISKYYGERDRVWPLKEIDLVTHEDEMIILMGPSGSGKTTLLSIIGGILHQSSGECLVLGKDINNLPEAERTEFRGKNIGFLFQYFNLVPTLTALENAALPLILTGTEREEAFNRAEEFLTHFGLDEQRYRIPDSLSGGEQQRVALARACIHKPKVLLCDEPTSFLDKERGRKTMELLAAIKKENNCTILVVSHDPRIASFADRILEIENGSLVHKDLNVPVG